MSMLAYIVPIQGSGGEVTPPIHYPPGVWPNPPGDRPGIWPRPPGGWPDHPIALPPEIWPGPPKPPNEVAPPIHLPWGGIIMPPIALPGGIVTPPIYYPPTVWPNPPGIPGVWPNPPDLPGLPTGKAFVAVYTKRSGWHAAVVDIPAGPPVSEPKK
jgi:hypothetical protein